MRQNVDISNLVGMIYEAAVDRHAWTPAMEAVADALRAEAVSLDVVHMDGKQAPHIVAPRTSPEWLRLFHDRWARSNFIRERGLLLGPGSVYRLQDLVSWEELRASEFYNEFWVPQRMHTAIFANVFGTGSIVAGVGFYRSSATGQFGPRAERLLSALVPHMQRAIALSSHLERAEMRVNTTSGGLNHLGYGALLVDPEARILFANLAADQLLNADRGLRACSGRLITSFPAKTQILHRLIAGKSTKEHAGGVLTVPCPDGNSLVLSVSPVHVETAWLAERPGAIVFVKDPARLPSIEEIQLLFGLTPAQAAVAREILQGDGVDAAAARLRIAPATARTHLLEVFQKTGTRRQAELVRATLQQAIMPVDNQPGANQFPRLHQTADAGNQRLS
jgi:DNA-binding CsgD family transcriptional regulator